MEDMHKTKKQLAVELAQLRQQLADARQQLAERSAPRLAHPSDDTSADGTVDVDPEGRITACNQAYAAMLGYRPEELTGTPYSALMPSRWHAAYHNIVQEVMTRGYSYEYEMEYTRKEGGAIPVSLRTWRIDDPDGTPIGLHSVVRDITARKQVEREREHYSERLEDLIEDRTRTLRESGENFRALAENADDGILISLAADETHAYVNRRAAEITGYTASELLRTTLKDLIAPEGFGQVAAGFKTQSAPPHRPRRIETTIVQSNGDRVPVELTVSRTVWHGRSAFMTILRDITERKRAERALLEREEHYRQAVDNFPNPIFSVDRNGLVQTWNPACEHVFQYQASEAIGQPYHKFLWNPDDRTAIEALLAQVWQGVSVGQQEMAYRSADGTRRFTVSRLYPLYHLDGKVQMCVFANTDITDRKRTEEALRESEEMYRMLIETSPYAVTTTDLEGRITYVSQQALKLHGTDTPQDLIGKPAFELIAPQDRERAWANLQRTLQGEIVRDLEYVMLRKDGSSFVAQLSAALVQDARGDPRAFLATATDITEYKRAENALRESEARYRAIFNQSPDFIYLTDPQGNIIDANPSMLRETGLSLEEIRQRNIVQALSGENVEELCQAYRAILDGYEVKGLQVQVRHPRRARREYEINAIPLMEDGKVVATLNMARDITDRKRLEEQMRQQEQMAAIGRLAGGIAHGFNNFLMSIMLYAQIMLRKPDLSPALTPYVETILKESQRAAGLVRQILDFSRRSLIETQAVDLASFTRRTFDFLREMLPENIRLFFEVEADERCAPLTAYVDPTCIQQAIVNMALNARDAMPGGGILRIALARVRVLPDEAPPVAGMPPGNWARLTISDTGIGMTEEVRSHLFEPFFTTKESGQGTGLGLAQVYGIVKQHGGYIDVETQAGQGTTFAIYLPLQSGEEEELAAEKLEDLPQGQGETILLAEDEDMIRNAEQEMLESLGYRVLTAANGCEALEVCRSAEGIDLVLTDLVMPEVGGLELIRKLRENHPDIRTLVITGYPNLQAEEREALQKMGLLVEIIPKPIEAHVLAKTIRQLLDAER